MMVSSDYAKLFERIGSARDSYFVGPAPESLIETAETRLGVRFPPSYRSFLSHFGCGSFAGLEIYGIVRKGIDAPGAPNMVWMTIEERALRHINPKVIVIGDGGDGTLVAIDCSRALSDSECPVVRLGVGGIVVETIADSFSKFLDEEASWRLDE